MWVHNDIMRLIVYSSFVPGIKLLWDGVSFLELSVPPKFRNRMCGLCGNYDGDKGWIDWSN